MEWTLINKNTVETEDGKSYAIELNWLPFDIETREIHKKMKLSKQVSDNKVEFGASISNPNSGVIQLADAPSESKGKLSLACALATSENANSIFFMKVTDGQYWVACVNQDGSIEMTSDRVMTFYALRDYVSERLALNSDDNQPEIYNMGVNLTFDDLDIDEKVQFFDISTLPDEKKNLNAMVKPMSGSFNKKLMFAGQAVLVSIAGGVYYYLTSDADDLLAIKNGDHSAPFESAYNKLRNDYNKIKGSAKKKRMNEESFIKEGREQFNNKMLASNLSNREIADHFDAIKKISPPFLGGWSIREIAYENEKFYLFYGRQGSYPLSVTYKDFDALLEGDFEKYASVGVTPIRIEEDGNVRVFEVSVQKADNPALLEFISSKKLISKRRNDASADIAKNLSDLNVFSDNIGELEGSLDMLTIWDKKNTELIGNIAENITNIVHKAQPTIKETQKKIREYNEIEDVSIPAHVEKLLPEGGVEDVIYPVLQSYGNLSWGSATMTGGYPSGIDDSAFEGEKIITTYEMNLLLNGSQERFNQMSSILDPEYITITGIKNTFSGVDDKVSFYIRVNEINQDYISLDK
ncbi:hypothetical protein [Vibrio crassostreae]|uniref:hypothetical protein n=1 Tax=Vibrio crassostreae TaxID=246167 RepID=UPI001B3037BB|nr:hypothetical protein [Vibrio crassostreae]